MESNSNYTWSGCTPKGRLTEQHDIFFELNFCKDLVPEMKAFGLKPKKFISMLGAKSQL
jgi:hypothetical protein